MGTMVLLLLLAAAPPAAGVELAVDSLTADRERPVRGAVYARCGERGSIIELEVEGLEPFGRYSLWMFVFRASNAQSRSDVVAAGAAGRAPAHEFSADRSGRAHLVLHQPAGPLSGFGAAGRCLLDAPQWRLVGGLHPRGVRAGAFMPPAGEIVEQFGVTYVRSTR